MDSLLANYAASDDEEDQQEQQPPPRPSSSSTAQRSEYSDSSSSRSSSLFSSLPPPKSSSLFQSLPQPKQSSKPSLPTGFFDNDKKNEDVEEGDSDSASKFGATSIKSSSLFSSLPRPKGNPTNSSSSWSSSRIEGDSDGNLPKSASMFSSLPQPNSQKLQQPKSNPSSSESQPKRVVLFKPPVNSSLLKLSEDDDDDDDEEEEERRLRKASESSFQTPSVTSFLSSIPAPKNLATLGVMSSSGSGRRSILETNVSVSASDDSNMVNDSRITQNIDDCAENYGSGVEQNVANHRENYDNAANYNFGIEQNAWNYANYDSYGNYHYSIDQNVVGETQSVSSAGNAGDYGSYENYGNYGDQIQYVSNPAGRPAMVDTEKAVRIPEKRRRNEVPSEIVEVKQDELIKNRPRQDQVKLTGIAFGPSYQPTSTKGKPSKLHKRKHQITSLYYDMKQKEMELAERRARGLLTKAETQAKYGW